MEEDSRISRQLKSVNDKIRQTGDATFASYGLTGPQVGYISLIMDAGGAMPQNALEKAAGVSHPTVVGIVTRLREKGYVDIEIDPKDRRKRIIRATEKARVVNQDIQDDYEAMSSRLFIGMSQQEKAEFSRCLAIIDQNVSERLKAGEKVEK